MDFKEARKDCVYEQNKDWFHVTLLFFSNTFAALETKMRRLLYKMDVAVCLFSWCPAVAKTSEEELLPVQVIDGKTISDHLEVKPKSCTLQENKQSLWNTTD